MTKPLKNITAFLQSEHHDLHFLLTKSKKLLELNEKIIAYIEPATLREYCQVANINKNKLTLLVANGSVATQLRFQTQHLLTQFKKNQALRMIEEIQIKLQSFADYQTTQKKRKTVALLSEKTAEIVRNMAQTVVDSRLREIMERIATRVKKT